MIVPIILVDQGCHAQTAPHPFSIAGVPVFFAPLVDGDSLFQDCLERVSDPLFADPIVVVSPRYQQAVQQQADDIGYDTAQIVVCDADQSLQNCLVDFVKPDDVVLLCPVSSYAADQAAFVRAVEAAGETAEQGHRVHLGAVSEWPVIGQDYLHVGTRIDTRLGGHNVLGLQRPQTYAAAVDLQLQGTWVWDTGIVALKWDQLGVEKDPIVISLLGAWAHPTTWPFVWHLKNLLQ